MKPRSIGIVAGGGGPIGSLSVLKSILDQCQKKYGSWRSYEYPCLNFYAFPYSEMLLVDNNTSGIPGRELSYSIQQLKILGMEIVVIPCFTLSSYLTYRNYGVELIEMGQVMRMHLENMKIRNPIVLCSERTRKSTYCDKLFACHYPELSIQNELNAMIEAALKGEKVDIKPLLKKLPNVPILSATTVLNAQLLAEVDDPRWINSNQVLAQYVVHRSFGADGEKREGYSDIHQEAAMIGY